MRHASVNYKLQPRAAWQYEPRDPNVASTISTSAHLLPAETVAPSFGSMEQETLRPSKLRTEHGFNVALEMFKGLVQKSSFRFDWIVEKALLDTGLLPRFVTSTHPGVIIKKSSHMPQFIEMPSRDYATFRGNLVAQLTRMQTQPISEFRSSCFHPIMTMFQAYFGVLSVPFPDLSEKLGISITAAALILSILPVLETYQLSDLELNTAARYESIHGLSSRAFEAYGIEVPETREQATRLAARLLRRLALILKVSIHELMLFS